MLRFRLNKPISDSQIVFYIHLLVVQAAAAQDKFWEMHDYLFEHHKVLDYTHLL
jgi:hypothetical protein